MKWECDLGCEDPLPIESMEEMEAHLRLHHPEIPVGFTTLPDGTVVILDDPAESQTGGTDGS